MPGTINGRPGGAAITAGLILMWSGTIATIPSGWVLCNGSNGTPDLRNQFVVCADADSGGAAKTSLLGAAAQSGGSTQHDHDVGSLVTQVQGGTADTNVTQTVNANTDTTETVPPFYALAYIMKT